MSWCGHQGQHRALRLRGGEAASGLARAGWDVNKPVIFGVLTTDTIEQSIERAGTKLGNKGYEAALAAVETVRVLQQISEA